MLTNLFKSSVRLARSMMHILQIHVLLAKPNKVSRPANSKKILFVGDLTFTGGTFVFFRQALSSVCSWGMTVDVLTHPGCFQSQLTEWADTENLNIKFLDDNREITLFRRVMKACASSGYAFVLVSSGGLGGFASLFSLPLPILFFVHTIQTHFSFKERHFLHAFMDNRKRLVGVSQASMNGLLKAVNGCVPESNITWLYNHVQDAYEPALKPEHPSMVLTVGHLNEYKNPRLWVRIAKAILSVYPYLEFVWMGEGVLLDECRALAADEPRIMFGGFQNDLNPLYARTLVYFQPSATESFGLSVAEAMMWGVPCLVSNRGALPELVNDPITGKVFDLDDPFQAVKIFAEMVDAGPDALEKMGKAARARYEAQFSPPAWEQGFKGILECVGVVV